MKLQFSLVACCLTLGIIFSSCDSGRKASIDNRYNAEVVIYGGTSSAVIAAVQVAKMGKKVVLISPVKHLGGLSSSGLGWTDTGNKAVIGGLARNFYHRLYLHYQEEASWKWQKKSEYGNTGQGNVALDGEFRTMWIFEPHAAEKVFEDLLTDYEIPVHREEWLDRENGVTTVNGSIQSFRTLSGKVFTGRIFIDATYEGDLMAAAGISYTIGREGNDQYGENLNGVQANDTSLTL
ncbi:MAG: FAD-dependent oxidoreductase, partial [Bacteroidales bacterium]|nr:FAD-dependent oxidoreductase [Bacteroidales bacterium]